VGESERGRAAGATPDDNDGGHQATPSAPPPRVLDLGNGEAFAVGTAADMLAAADWLERNHPDGVQGERAGPVIGPVLNMGASNAMAAYTAYASRLPAKSMLVLAWMALVSLDADTEPWWSQGHDVLATMALGRKGPITAADLRAVERAVQPLFQAGAITVDRHSSGHPGRALHVRYRLWLAHPAPDEKRRVQNRPPPAESAPPQNLHPAAPDENRRTPDTGTRQFLGPHPTVFGAAPDEKRRTNEYEEYEERIENQEELFSSATPATDRGREARDDDGDFDWPTASEQTGGAGAPLSEAAKTAASDETTPAAPWLALGCSWCGADVGKPCTNQGTGKARAPHSARLDDLAPAAAS
jgi:hypothetical protein